MLKRGVQDYLPPIILCVHVSFSLRKVVLPEVDLRFLLPATSRGTSFIYLNSHGARLRINFSSVIPKESNAASM